MQFSKSPGQKRTFRPILDVRIGVTLAFLLVLLLTAAFGFPSVTATHITDGLRSSSSSNPLASPTSVYTPTLNFSQSPFFRALTSWIYRDDPAFIPTMWLTPTVHLRLTPIRMAGAEVPSVCDSSYTVQVNDVLGAIAERFGVTVAQLAEFNNLADVNNISEGQVLILPCPRGTAATATVSGSNGQSEAEVGILVTPTLQLSHITETLTLDVYQFGSGPRRVALIGGIHGGYEWNTILLAYQAIDYFTKYPEEVPISVTLFLIPSANPDGQARVVGHAGRFRPEEITGDTKPGRFNRENVDLNRNWDCNWQPIGLWGQQEVDGGSAPFSEVENQLLRDFLVDPPMNAVIFWHSALPGVIPGTCGQPFPDAIHLAEIYASESGYPLMDTFANYQVTGDATDWLAMQNIPAITVELSSHQDTEWLTNLAAIKSVLQFVANDVSESSATQKAP